LTLPAVEQVGRPPRLGGFVARQHSEPVNEALIERVRSAYAPVLPMLVADEDLATFLTVLHAAVRYWRPRAVVQTGTFVGASAIAIALALARNRTGELYTIDPEPPEYFGVREPVAIARRVIESAGLASRVNLVKGYSARR
jgi:predicted O-methyltransferase YrrM